MTEQPQPTKKVAADGHEYHLSATANATVAPTNEATLANLIPKDLGSDQLEFVTLVSYEFNLKGTIDKDFICEEYSFTSDEFDNFINNPKVKAHLMQRGIGAKFFEPLAGGNSPVEKPKGAPLTYIQLQLANALLDINDTKSLKKKLQDHGITTRQYQTWMKDPAFVTYMREMAEQLIGTEVQHEAMLALADKVMSGDLSAIKYYHAMTGRYVEPSASNNGANSSHDLQQMIVKIVEIIIDEVDDRDTAIRISERIKGLVIGQQVAGIMDSPVIEKPEIAKPREMTPKMLELMERGVGVND